MWYTEKDTQVSKVCHLLKKRYVIMKTAAQVFIILSMVCGFWMILPLIFGGIALSQMSKGQRPSTGISVCVLLFCSFVGGILLLCARMRTSTSPV